MSDERSKPRIFVFYAGMLHSEWYVFPRLTDLGTEVYNGSFVLIHSQWQPKAIFEEVGWYRADKTPYPEKDVPAELKLLALLLT